MTHAGHTQHAGTATDRNHLGISRRALLSMGVGLGAAALIGRFPFAQAAGAGAAAQSLADLFPGFEETWIELGPIKLFARVGGPAKAPAVLLLHGFPQSHLCWHTVAPGLARTHRIVCLDLKGYGRSSAPSGDRAHRDYSKRTWARECIAAMQQLGHRRFSIFGHDRGAQVAYRMALDSPERVAHVAILDNLPVYMVWQQIDARSGFLPWWELMARPAPEPEKILTAEYIEGLVRIGTPARLEDIFHPLVLADYRANWGDPARVHAYCEDYRAGAGPDIIADRDDLERGRRISCPTLVMWSRRVFGTDAEQPVDAWRRSFAPDAYGAVLDSGHFLMEEKPEETLAALRDLLARPS